MRMAHENTLPVVVIGGGAAGLMAAVSAAEAGAKVLLLEKNEKPGKKLYITGKGRCNFTNRCETEAFFANVPRNPRFLYSAVYGFDPEAVIAWFEAQGLRTKTERGNRVFPLSDHASDVTAALVRALERTGAKARYRACVRKILTEKEGESDAAGVTGVQLTDGSVIPCSAVIVATGGLSYPSTGSTGDGYRFAREAGHSVTECSPSLVPMNTEEADIPLLQGLSLKNVELTILDGKKKLFQAFGEMMFTHFGVTGPLVLTASASVQKQLAKHPLKARIDLKPALNEEELDARILRAFSENRNKAFRNALGGLYPAKLIPVIVERTGIDPDKPVHDITKGERRRLAEETRAFPFTITSLRGFHEAVITRGGVSVKEVDPSTMESRLVRGLFFAGEVLDTDALTGGFNVQIAWSTGRAAGSAAAQAGVLRQQKEDRKG